MTWPNPLTLLKLADEREQAGQPGLARELRDIAEKGLSMDELRNEADRLRLVIRDLEAENQRLRTIQDIRTTESYLAWKDEAESIRAEITSLREGA